MGQIHKGIYKQWSGTDWDEIYFKTSADMVQQTNLRVFLNPSVMKVNDKEFATVSQGPDGTYTVEQKPIVLYAGDIKLDYLSGSKDLKTLIDGKIDKNGSTTTLTVDTWLRSATSSTSYGFSIGNYNTDGVTPIGAWFGYKGGSFISSDAAQTATQRELTLPFEDVSAGGSISLATRSWVGKQGYVAKNADGVVKNLPVENISLLSDTIGVESKIGESLSYNKFKFPLNGSINGDERTLVTTDYIAYKNNAGGCYGGLISGEDYQKLMHMWEFWVADSGENDNGLVDKIAEVLKAFEEFDEGSSIVDHLNNKLNKENGVATNLTIKKTFTVGDSGNTPTIHFYDTKLQLGRAQSVVKFPVETNTKSTITLADQDWVDKNYLKIDEIPNSNGLYDATLSGNIGVIGGYLHTTDISAGNSLSVHPGYFRVVTGIGASPTQTTYYFTTGSSTEQFILTDQSVYNYVPRITVQPTAPGSPSRGDIWIDI